MKWSKWIRIALAFFVLVGLLLTAFIYKTRHVSEQLLAVQTIYSPVLKKRHLELERIRQVQERCHAFGVSQSDDPSKLDQQDSQVSTDELLSFSMPYAGCLHQDLMEQPVISIDEAMLYYTAVSPIRFSQSKQNIQDPALMAQIKTIRDKTDATFMQELQLASFVDTRHRHICDGVVAMMVCKSYLNTQREETVKHYFILQSISLQEHLVRVLWQIDHPQETLDYFTKIQRITQQNAGTDATPTLPTRTPNAPWEAAIKAFDAQMQPWFQDLDALPANVKASLTSKTEQGP